MFPEINLHAADTLNCRKVTIVLGKLNAATTRDHADISQWKEELKLAYPQDSIIYDMTPISLKVNEQKENWFLEINPNGRIPAIIHAQPDGAKVALFESAAIQLYLAQLYDKEFKIMFSPSSEYYPEALQWIFFAHGGVSPMQSQAIHFEYAAPEKISYALNRYVGETERLYAVLEMRLKNREYLAGPGRGVPSLVDFNVWPSVASYSTNPIGDLAKFPHLAAWVKRIQARPGVRAGLEVLVPLETPPWIRKA